MSRTVRAKKIGTSKHPLDGRIVRKRKKGSRKNKRNAPPKTKGSQYT